MTGNPYEAPTSASSVSHASITKLKKIRKISGIIFVIGLGVSLLARFGMDAFRNSTFATLPENSKSVSGYLLLFIGFYSILLFTIIASGVTVILTTFGMAYRRRKLKQNV